ncbi:MAG: cupin domain-containing protein [Pseudomonadota bacterium]
MEKKPLVNLDELKFFEMSQGEKYGAMLAPIGSEIGAEKLGCRVTVLQPGKRAWPKHSHLVNEELFFILEGEGTAVIGDTEYAIRAGDMVACLPRKELAHQILNTSDRELKYLAISTMEEPDVCLYPDSNKFGVFAGAAPGGDGAARSFSIYASRDSEMDYWEGED